MLSVLMVGYRSKPFLAASLGTLLDALADIDGLIYFTDNGDDGSEEFVRAEFPQITVVPSHGNIGFGRGNNLLARHTNSDWLLVVNPDIVVKPDTISRLLQFVEFHNEFDIVSGVMVDPDENIDSRTISRLPNLHDLLWGLVGRAERHQPIDLSQPIVEVPAVNGGFMLIRNSAWQNVGGFDESFFLYAEELDFCARVAAKGGKIGIVPSSRLSHDIGSGNFFGPDRILYQLTGNAHYYRKHFGAIRAAIMIAVLWLSCVIRFGVGAILGFFQNRYARMSRAFRKPACRPWTWMRGYPDRPSQP